MDERRLDHIRALIESLNDVNYIKSDDIPNIDLYMDQVTTFMDEKLKSSKRHSDDKILTKTMINNYTKNKLIPPPNKKKYSKDHMVLLIYIYYFKNLLSINDIQSIFTPLIEKFYGGKSEFNLEDIYRNVVKLEEEQTDNLVKDMIRKMKKAEESYEDVKEPGDKEFLTLFSFISALSYDVYIRKQMIENIIDSLDEETINEKDKDKSKK